jgi:glycosyltransferase involved in cell wall biosynthesis
MLGYVSDELLPPLVAGADSVVMVGLREGFGLPVLEALSAGRSVCVSAAGALPEVAGPLGVRCDPLEPVSIAAALEQATLDPQIRARAQTEGPAWAKKHGWEQTAEGLLNACSRALGSSEHG